MTLYGLNGLVWLGLSCHIVQIDMYVRTSSARREREVVNKK